MPDRLSPLNALVRWLALMTNCYPINSYFSEMVFIDNHKIFICDFFYGN